MHGQISQLLSSFRPPQSALQSFLLSFEGPEGSGKSTQIQLLSTELSRLGFRVFQLREPGGTLYGEGLRNVILNHPTPLHPLSEAYLFASSRCQLLEEKILPALQQEKTIVIIDRYIDSSFVYQGFGRHLGPETLIKIHSIAPLNTLPHLTFYLKISLPTSMNRMHKRGAKKDYFESSHHNFFKTVLDGYEQLVTVFPERIIPIDGERASEEVFEQIKQVWQKFIAKESAKASL